MKDNIKKIYVEWLEDTINADVPYQLDPAVGEVVEDLNLYTGLDLDWEEWNEYYEDSTDTIEYLEERADARKRFDGRRYGDLTEKEKNEIMNRISSMSKAVSGDVTILDFENTLRLAVRESDGAEDDSKFMDEAVFYFPDEA